jgi:hypothetical protein
VKGLGLTLFEVLYLVTGVMLAGSIIYRLTASWYNLLVPQRTFLLGLFVVSFGVTQRGLELLFFDAPPPRPAAYISITGFLLIVAGVLRPIDKRMVPAWQKALKEQEPDNYDKYIELLNKSAAVRNASTKHAPEYKQILTDPELSRSTSQQERDGNQSAMDILAASQTNRKLDNNSESTEDNGFDARHASW